MVLVIFMLDNEGYRYIFIILQGVSGE